MKNVTDVELIQKTLDGETDAFGELIRRYQDAVYATALHRAGNFADAQDIAQEAFLKAYQKLQTLREPAKFPSWLHTITLRECNHWQRKQRETLPIEELNDAQMLTISNGYGTLQSRVPCNVLSHVPLPDEELERKELRQLVLHAIASLPEKVGEAVTLYYIDGLSYDEIADFLSVPASTVKGRLQTGRKQLKEEFITMVEGTLKQNRPDEKFTEKVLNEIIESAKQARERKAHDEVVRLCEKALETLGHLETTIEHKRTEMDVLNWQGDEWLKWFGKPQDAAENFRRAFDIAEKLGDKESQAKWLLMRAISFSHAGDYKAMIRPVQQASAIYAELGQTQHEVICAAILDLIDLLPADWERVVDPGEYKTGYAIHRYRLVRSPEVLKFIEEKRPEPETWCEWVVPNLMRSGYFFRWEALIALAGQPQTILTFPIEVGDCWKGTLETGDGEILSVMRMIEAKDDTMCCPPGKFEHCLRVKTVISEPDGADFSDRMKIFRRRSLCGVRTMWFAPGIGLIKYRHEREEGGSHTVQLLSFHVGFDTPSATQPKGSETSGNYFPLSIGNRWKYERPTDWCKTRTIEAYRVVAQENENFHIACAAYSKAMNDATQRSFFQMWFEQEKASKDRRGQAWMLLRLANLYAQLGEKESAMAAYWQLDELTAQLGDAKLQFETLLDTEWANPFHFVSERYEHALQIADEIGDLERQQRCLAIIVDYYLRREQYAKAIEYAQRRLAIAEKFGDMESKVEAESEIDLASALIDEPNSDKVIEGGVRGPVFAKISESEIVVPDAGGIFPVALGRRPGPSLYSLGGFWSDVPLLKLPVTKGETWSRSDHDDTIERIVEATDETVSVPAGDFNHCVKVKTTVQMRPANEGSPQADELYNRRKEYREGEKWMWFAKDVGVVKVEHHHPNGKQTIIELTDYHLVEPSNAYFPISIGNRWRYEWRDENGELLFKEQERVILEHKEAFYLACSAYTTNAAEYVDLE